MTVYKAIKPEAEQAAELAVALINGDRARADSLATAKVDNGQKQVSSILLEPVAVTKDNIKDTIIKDNFHPVDKICSGPAAAACTEAGIS
jgi:D-xylose transport system substrate-binding protein